VDRKSGIHQVRASFARMNLHTEEIEVPTIEDLAASIRRIRKSRGWTLKEVEEKSNGKWKAVVIGSYERCDRALSLNKAIALAAFYKVPLEELLGITPPTQALNERITFDIRRVKDSREESLKALQRFITTVCGARRDWNGELLSVRSSDTLALSAAIHMPPAQLKDALHAYGLTFNPVSV
jgi:transcriptional regulator with XRE-family HTH domain